MLNVRGDVDYLLFPVKPSWCRRAALAVAGLRTASGWGYTVGLAVAGLLTASGCGYRSLAAPSAGERLCVLAAPPKVPDFGAVQATLDGAREELARRAALRDSGYPCLVIEVLRVDEVASGIVASDTAGAERPRARGTGVAVVGRAWVQDNADAPLSRDTGDVRRAARSETTAPPLEGTRHDRELARAGAELGRDLARRVLGLPTPSDELP